MSDKANDHSGTKKARMWLNEAKHRQTTHWDVDVLPEAEVEALYRAGRRRRWRKRLAYLGLGIAVIGIATAVTAAVMWLIA